MVKILGEILKALQVLECYNNSTIDLTTDELMNITNKWYDIVQLKVSKRGTPSNWDDLLSYSWTISFLIVESI